MPQTPAPTPLTLLGDGDIVEQKTGQNPQPRDHIDQQ
jgi:hypothetical protein